MELKGSSALRCVCLVYKEGRVRKCGELGKRERRLAVLINFKGPRAMCDDGDAVWRQRGTVGWSPRSDVSLSGLRSSHGHTQHETVFAHSFLNIMLIEWSS